MKDAGGEFPVFKLKGEIFVEPMKELDGFYSKIIGVKEQVFIIIDNPLPGEKSSLISPLMPVWIRYFNGIIYRFKSKILRILSEPAPLIFIQFPITVEKIDYRKEGRKKVFIQTEVYGLTHQLERIPVRGYILDISMTGALILADLTRFLERDVSIVFRVPWLMKTFKLKGRVIRCDASAEGVRCGVQFLDLTDSASVDLERLIRSIERGEFLTQV